MKWLRRVIFVLVGMFLLWVLAVAVREVSQRPKGYVGMAPQALIACGEAQEKAAKHCWFPPFRVFVMLGTHDDVEFRTHYYFFSERHIFLTRHESFSFTNGAVASIYGPYWIFRDE